MDIDIKHLLRQIKAALQGRRPAGRGQSLVELTITLPILILLFFGMVEIGWYANNYLVLLDASREAGRYGATDDPIAQWSQDLSNDPYRHDCCVGAECCVGNNCCVVGADLRDGECCIGAECKDEFRRGNIYFTNTRPEMQRFYLAAQTFIDNNPGSEAADRLRRSQNAPLRYFDGVACRVLYNMSPLEFNWNTDEVVVSTFSYVPPYDKDTDYTAYDLPGDWIFSRITPSYPETGGRLPLERNNCLHASPVENTIYHIGFTLTGVGDNLCSPSTDYIDDPGDPGYPGNPEAFCGQCDPTTDEFCANHRRDDFCYGSEWDPIEIENRLYEFEGQGLAGGLVLVEVFWKHEQLLNMPVISALNAYTEDVYVWIMFPVSAAEPTPTP